MRHEGKVWAWTAVVAAAAAGVLGALFAREGWPHAVGGWWCLPLFSALLAMAERLRIRVRVGGQVDAANLIESILAPLLFAYPSLFVVLVVAAAQLANALIRRGPLVKNAFNLAQWMLAAGCGALVLQYGAPGPYHSVTPRHLAMLLAALAAVGAVNIGVFFVVLALVRGKSLRAFVVEMHRVVGVVWVGSWAINVLFGLLYTFAFHGSRFAIVLMAVPLVVLHVAYKGLAAVTADQQRLAGLHQAASSLASPVDPAEAIPSFLESLAECFEGRGAALVLPSSDTRRVHLWDAEAEPRYSVVEQPLVAATVEAILASLPDPVQITNRAQDALALMLRSRGWHNCLSAPLSEDGERAGCLIVMDQEGVEGSARGELAVLAALARETAGTFAKGRLLADVLEERRKLAELIDATSDGLLSLRADGSPVAWNPALERITGVPAADAIGNPAAVLRLRARTAEGHHIDLTRWTAVPNLPPDLRIASADGTERRLSCSYNRVVDGGDGDGVLVVVARDVTADEEMRALRQEFDRLTEQQTAARTVVEQLQQAVVPPAPAMVEAELAVEYVPSDDVAPTGGDLYDWQVLADGDLHVAVVDVLGHGVSATKAALSVIHALRVVAAEGTPLGDIIARVDGLMQRQEPDLVATAVVARYTPSTGRLRVASGGHPPALIVRRDGSVNLADATGGTIGWPNAGSDNVSELHLDLGDTLLLYTDGLVEARKDMLAGLELLVSAAGAAAGLPTGSLPAAMVERMLSGAERRDDTLALALRRCATADEFTTSVVPDWSGVGRARRHLGSWLSGLGLDAADATLVASELAGNAARAARTRLELSAKLSGSGLLTLVVKDDGPGDPLLRTRGLFPPPEGWEEGRGLFIVRSLCDDVSVQSSASGTTATCTLRPRPGPAEAEEDGFSESTGLAGSSKRRQQPGLEPPTYPPPNLPPRNLPPRNLPPRNLPPRNLPPPNFPPPNFPPPPAPPAPG